MQHIRACTKKWIVKICMFISSYFPLYIMLLILEYNSFNTKKKLLEGGSLIFVLCMFVFLVISVGSTIIIFCSKGSKPLKINDFERPDDTIISYMMTYIIPLLSNDYQNMQVIAVNIILFLLIGYLYIRLNLMYLNPLWSICGYLPYRINSEIVVITDLKYSELKYFKRNNQKLKGIYVANDIFIAKRKNNSIDI